MDPVTHGLIGASAAQSVADKENIRYATIIGLISAMIADLDVFISDPDNPLLNIELHRQFSHSLIFIPVGALIATALLWWFFREKFSLRQIYGFSLLGYATSGIVDTFTSFGTQLLWPFLEERYSWNIISVFDPLFSLGILTAVFLAMYKKKSIYAWFGWGWILLYLLFGFVQHDRGRTMALELADQRGHKIDRLVVKPTLANTLLWSIRYEYRDTLYADGVYLPPFGKPIIYEGESSPLLNWRKQYQSYRGTTLYDDIRRFNTLSEGYLVQHPRHENVLGDGRYAMLPTEINPLWGIKVDTTQPKQHLPFNSYRNATSKIRSRYIEMLFGESPH